jgi:hypothetical protein
MRGSPVLDRRLLLSSARPVFRHGLVGEHRLRPACLTTILCSVLYLLLHAYIVSPSLFVGSF